MFSPRSGRRLGDESGETVGSRAVRGRGEAMCKMPLESIALRDKSSRRVISSQLLQLLWLRPWPAMRDMRQYAARDRCAGRPHLEARDEQSASHPGGGLSGSRFLLRSLEAPAKAAQ